MAIRVGTVVRLQKWVHVHPFARKTGVVHDVYNEDGWVTYVVDLPDGDRVRGLWESDLIVLYDETPEQS